jgi:DNA-3-methyladenine glycosylase
MLLERSFYERPPQVVARELLGARLVRVLAGVRLAGRITETEAYDGESDLACHARAGLTPRTRVMYGEAGHAYIYFTYGVHWMLNAVTGREGWPAAVLIRAIQPVEGLEAMAALRPVSRAWTDGPAKLCQALNITGDLNEVDLCDPRSGLFIEADLAIANEKVSTHPRIRSTRCQSRGNRSRGTIR